jgi:hypothetical protein
MRPSEAIVAPQVCYRCCHSSFLFPGATKGGTVAARFSLSRGISVLTQESRPQAIARRDALYHGSARFSQIFMSGGPPSAHEVYLVAHMLARINKGTYFNQKNVGKAGSAPGSVGFHQRRG